MGERMTELSPENLSWLRIIHLAPGLEIRRYGIYKSTVTSLGDLVICYNKRLTVSETGLALLDDLGLRQFGREEHDDVHEDELRDRMSTLQLVDYMEHEDE